MEVSKNKKAKLKLEEYLGGETESYRKHGFNIWEEF